LTYGVVGRIVPPTPSVEYEKHYRTARLHVISLRLQHAVVKGLPWPAPRDARCAQSPICGQLADIEACSEPIMGVPLIYRLNADLTMAEKRDLAA
jgi:hypothetical protein